MINPLSIVAPDKLITVVRAIEEIKYGNGNLSVLIELLQAWLEKQDEENRIADAPMLHRGQGSAQTLATLLELLTQSDVILKKLLEPLAR